MFDVMANYVASSWNAILHGDFGPDAAIWNRTIQAGEASGEGFIR
jgi:hypothetical protein